MVWKFEVKLPSEQLGDPLAGEGCDGELGQLLAETFRDDGVECRAEVHE